MALITLVISVSVIKNKLDSDFLTVIEIAEKVINKMHALHCQTFCDDSGNLTYQNYKF